MCVRASVSVCELVCVRTCRNAQCHCAGDRVWRSRLSTGSGSTHTSEASGASSRTTSSSCGSTSSVIDTGDELLLPQQPQRAHDACILLVT